MNVTRFCALFDAYNEPRKKQEALKEEAKKRSLSEYMITGGR